MAVQSENERNKAVVDEYVAAWGGGFPIKVNGEVVGAIGLSIALLRPGVDLARKEKI